MNSSLTTHPVVLPINQRKDIPEAAIDDIARQIAEKFQPEKIILFGSYAYGRPRPESDVDLLVIMETDRKPGERSFLIRRAIEYHFGLDLIVKTPLEIKKSIQDGDFFIRDIVQKGKALYERHAG